MIRRLALTAGFAVLGTVAFAPNAQAQTAAPAETEMVPFSGTVGSVCTFTDTKPGTLALASDSMLDSQATGEGGQPGTTTVECTGGGNISVAKPQPVNVPNNFTAVNSSAEVTDNNGGNTNDGGTPFPVNPGTVALEVNMFVDGGAPLPPGVYEYNVPVTATPN